VVAPLAGAAMMPADRVISKSRSSNQPAQ
jgi:hypothetical protein